MNTIRIAVVALNQTPMDWDGNRDRILDAIDTARQRGANLVCLPELCISGYGCEDAFHSPSTWRLALDVLHEIVPSTAGLAVSVGLPLFSHGALYNSVALLVDGKVAGFVPKQHLAGDGLHYEPRWFKAWPTSQRSTFDLNGATLPIGDLLFDLSGLRIGFEICEDAWVYDRPGDLLARQGVDVILNPSASHFAFEKKAVRERFVLDGSRAFGTVYAYSNLLGNEAGRVIYDGHAMIAANGRMIAQGPRFRYAPVVVTTADVDIEELRATRARLLSYQPNVVDSDNIVRADWEPTPLGSPITDEAEASWDDAPSDEEEFTRAITLGLRDYMVKSHSAGFVVSLSGGADSTAVVALIATMVDLSIREIGLDKTVEVLRAPNANDRPTIVRQILTTAYQSTRNSSDTTRSAARTVAEAIGATHHELDVDELVARYTRLIEATIGRALTWKDDDVALQNVQARVRAPSVWMLANLENKLLLATSNRSEAAVGYATMDGDTSGGLSPISGIDKAFLRRWLHWIETTGPEGGSPIPQLSVVNALTPTAELRPLERAQTDEDDLMPYPVLDAIEEAAIGRKRSPANVLRLIRGQFPQYDDSQLVRWIRRFHQLWSRNQWKRERYAPGFHVDDRSLDPKTWCRFPILSGGFDRELRELDVEVEATRRAP